MSNYKLQQAEAERYQQLFDFFSQEHGLTLTIGQMDDIIDAVETHKSKIMTYNKLEQALKNGDRVQLCTINEKGQAVDWNDVDKINRVFDTSRYRIIKDDGTIIDGTDTI